MSTTRIEINGIDKVRQYYLKMPKDLDRFVSRTNLNFMKSVQKTAKFLAPKDTGTLAEDIKLAPVRKGKNVKIWKISIVNPAAAPQEFGFVEHLAPILNSSKIPPGIYMVKKNTPFIRPAIEKNLSSFSQKLNNSVGRAIKK
ncbi:MAG TPA: hypothetical protein ENI61_05360 [Ignavibacteria bacterium]|nr:hypothetical protein [Ignavibacteria bacterium]